MSYELWWLRCDSRLEATNYELGQCVTNYELRVGELDGSAEVRTSLKIFKSPFL